MPALSQGWAAGSDNASITDPELTNVAQAMRNGKRVAMTNGVTKKRISRCPSVFDAPFYKLAAGSTLGAAEHLRGSTGGSHAWLLSGSLPYFSGVRDSLQL